MSPLEPPADPTFAELQTLEGEVIAALAAHRRWREAMRLAADPAAAAAAWLEPIEKCALTAWLGVRLPQAFRRSSLYERTMREHDEFHRAMDMVVRGEPDALRAFARAAILLKSSLDEWLTLSRAR